MLRRLKKQKVELTLESIKPSQMRIISMPKKGLEHHEHLECSKDILRLCKKEKGWIWFTSGDLAKVSKYAKKECYLKEDLKDLHSLKILDEESGTYRISINFLEVFKKQITK